MSETALAPFHPSGAGEIVRPEPLSLLPVFRGQQMLEAFTAYRDLQQALDHAMPDQLMDIRGRTFRKKGYWRAIATAFNLNVHCVREESDDYGWRVVYRAETQSGRFAEGDGACSNEEKADGQDSEHNVRSHAHTRAFNRAVSNLVGFGEVSAEEIGREGKHAPPLFIDTTTGKEAPTGVKPEPPPGYAYINTYDFKNGWHDVVIQVPDHGRLRLSTKTNEGAKANEAYRAGLPVKVEWAEKKPPKSGEGYLNKVLVWKPTPAPGEPVKAGEIAF